MGTRLSFLKLISLYATLLLAVNFCYGQEGKEHYPSEYKFSGAYITDLLNQPRTINNETVGLGDDSFSFSTFVVQLALDNEIEVTDSFNCKLLLEVTVDGEIEEKELQINHLYNSEEATVNVSSYALKEVDEFIIEVTAIELTNLNGDSLREIPNNVYLSNRGYLCVYVVIS